jgi:hypothetical protein
MLKEKSHDFLKKINHSYFVLSEKSFFFKLKSFLKFFIFSTKKKLIFPLYKSKIYYQTVFDFL